MSDVSKWSALSEELRKMLILRYEPIAIRLIEREEDIPERAIRPRRDKKKHMALCQAYALARRDLKTVYMDKADHWCWNPLIGFGLVECREGMDSFEEVCKYLGIGDMDAARAFFCNFPTLPVNKYIGILVSPLRDCDFEPDVTLIYCNNAQLRSIVWAVKNVTGKLVETQLDGIDSCVWSSVVPVKNGEYRVTIPDPGEYERAMADENEIIFSIPKGRCDELAAGLRGFYEHGMCYSQLSREMELDFARPPFYNTLFRIWGLDEGEVWGR